MGGVHSPDGRRVSSCKIKCRSMAIGGAKNEASTLLMRFGDVTIGKQSRWRNVLKLSDKMIEIKLVGTNQHGRRSGRGQRSQRIRRQLSALDGGGGRDSRGLHLLRPAIPPGVLRRSFFRNRLAGLPDGSIGPGFFGGLGGGVNSIGSRK